MKIELDELIARKTGKPQSYAGIDDLLRDFLGIKSNKRKFVNGWVTVIGLRVTMGMTLPECLMEFSLDGKHLDLIETTDWLIKNYHASEDI